MKELVGPARAHGPRPTAEPTVRMQYSDVLPWGSGATLPKKVGSSTAKASSLLGPHHR